MRRIAAQSEAPNREQREKGLSAFAQLGRLGALCYKGRTSGPSLKWKRWHLLLRRLDDGCDETGCALSHEFAPKAGFVYLLATLITLEWGGTVSRLRLFLDNLEQVWGLFTNG